MCDVFNESFSIEGGEPVDSPALMRGLKIKEEWALALAGQLPEKRYDPALPVNSRKVIEVRTFGPEQRQYLPKGASALAIGEPFYVLIIMLCVQCATFLSGAGQALL